MRLLAIMAVVGALALPGAASAQANCAAFNQAWSTMADNLAFIHAQTFADKSAVQATQRAAEEANLLSMMQTNVVLMQAAKCPLPTEPITRGAYAAKGQACAAATTIPEIEVACRNWVPVPNAPEPPSLKR